MPGETAKQLGSFQDPYNFETPTSYNPENGNKVTGNYTGNSIWHKLSDQLGLTDFQGQYDRYLSQQERDYERASINSARAWEEYLDSTKYQRMKADLEKAGMNPWLALQSGLSASAQSSSTDTGGTTGKRNSSQSKDPNLKGIVALIAAIAALL